jgi:uncharacterized protein (DUF1778 family)
LKRGKKVFRTKRPMVHATFRLKREEREIWRESAAKLGESLNDFVRIALVERGRKILLAASTALDQNAA